jgi:hypothetical protein
VTSKLVHLSLGPLALALAAAAASPARADAPAGRYTISGGTVVDTKTKLVWQQTPSTSTYTWSNAKTYCPSLASTLGGSGWRVPTLKELLTLVDRSRATGPVIDPTAFPATSSVLYWSATTMAWATGGAWIVNFATGEATTTGAVTNQNLVRCVR